MLRSCRRALPLFFALALAGIAVLSPVRQNPRALAAFLVAAAILAVWSAILIRSGRDFTLVFRASKQHYLQACAQLSVLLYWGWHWPQVYESAHFIVAQLLFAYAFDMLLGWSRRHEYVLGFGPFPVVFSINLFLWFKPDFFFLQFAMLALGFAAKEFLRWTRDGHSRHIFNPSSFPLAVFSLALLAAGSTDITWGREIAVTQFYPPQIILRGSKSEIRDRSPAALSAMACRQKWSDACRSASPPGP